MKRASLFLFALMLLSVSVWTVDAQLFERTVVINQNVNLRTEPSAEAELIVLVRRGTAFKIDGRTGTTGWVRGITEGGHVGWMVVAPTGLTTGDLLGIPILNGDEPFLLSAPDPASPAPASESSGEAPAVSNPSVSNTAPLRGFQYGGHIASLDANALGWMSYAGMTWIKRQVRYSDGQGAGGFADWINAAHASGLRILLGVVGYPGEIKNSGYFERYAAFTGQLAALGADAIEVWNEPNLDREWPTGQIDPARYTELLRQSYNAIKGANPNTLVVSGAPAPTGAESAFPGAVMNDDNFLRGMANAGAANYMDCIGAHYNEGIVPPTWTSGDPRGNSGYYTRYLPSMISVYSNAFGGRKQICFTELGYLTPEGYGPLSANFAWAENTSVAEQAEWIDGAISYASRSGRVRLVIIWNINYTSYGDDPMAGYALIRPGNSCPACDALAN